VLNLLPSVGLVAAKGVSAYLIWEARRVSVPIGTLLSMVGNLGLEALISAVPVAGWVGDVCYRANLRNMALLREHLERRGRSSGDGDPRPVLYQPPFLFTAAQVRPAFSDAPRRIELEAPLSG
jgi:hypothetical protein